MGDRLSPRVGGTDVHAPGVPCLKARSALRLDLLDAGLPVGKRPVPRPSWPLRDTLKGDRLALRQSLVTVLVQKVAFVVLERMESLFRLLRPDIIDKGE